MGIMQTWLEQDPCGKCVAAGLFFVANFFSVTGIVRPVEIGPKVMSKQDQIQKGKAIRNYDKA